MLKSALPPTSTPLFTPPSPPCVTTTDARVLAPQVVQSRKSKSWQRLGLSIQAPPSLEELRLGEALEYAGEAGVVPSWLQDQAEIPREV